MRNKVMIDPKHFMGAMADLPYALAKTSELFETDHVQHYVDSLS